MNIKSWDDLLSFVNNMSPSERREPVRIIFHDQPIVLVKEIERAHDFYIRPIGENVSGDPEQDVINSVDDYDLNKFNIKNWERTIDKGDIFLRAY